MKAEKEGFVWSVDENGQRRCTLVINESATIVAEMLALIAVMIALYKTTIKRKAKQKNPRLLRCRSGRGLFCLDLYSMPMILVLRSINAVMSSAVRGC